MNVMDTFRLDGKIALVTGGAGLYGVHISTALAEAGATVLIASRNEERCKSVAEELKAAGLQALAMNLNLCEESSIIETRDMILKEFGRLDVLFNNAVARAGGNIDHMTRQEWESTMVVNSTGLFLCCQLFGDEMAKRRSGSIVNICSIYGVVGPDFTIYENTPIQNPANYSFAKGGMVNFTRYLASFYGKFSIRVNCISPGGYYTGQHPEFVQKYCRNTPLGRMANSEDIKGPAVFLASDASAYITGHNLMVDGGWTAI